MDNYPSALKQHEGSKEMWRDQTELGYAKDGSLKGRIFYDSKKREFSIEHKLLTEADKTTLETFYDAHRGIEFLFAWNFAPATTYTVIFADTGGLSFKIKAGPRWETVVKLAET